MGKHLTEKQLKARLKSLAAAWPPGYWVFVGSGGFNLMACGEDGKRVFQSYDRDAHDKGGVDPAYIVETFKIPSDGGDW